MDRNAIDSRVIVPGHNSTNQSFFSNPDCSALENSSLKSAGVTAEKVWEELIPYFPYSTKKRKILAMPTSSGASEI
jgi:hypothetical protein